MRRPYKGAGMGDRHHRRSIRLRGYDYAQAGAYFVTMCTQDRVCLFGDVVEGEMVLNDVGQIVACVWQSIPAHFTHATLDEFVVMPNHVHGIVAFSAASDVGATHASPLPTSLRGPSRRSIGAIVGSFKSAVTKRINERRATPGAPLWQRNYYEHIIRDDESLNLIRQYIRDNPKHWATDHDNPAV